MVFSNIIITSTNFARQSDELATLNEQRDSELQSLRCANASREVRKEAEMEYRRRFLQVVVECCIDAQWPPAIEAFSNPYNLLVQDADARLHAMDYLLTNAILSSSSDATFLDIPPSPSNLSRASNVSPLPSPQQKTTPRKLRSAPSKPSALPTHPPATPSAARSTTSRRTQPTEGDYAALLASYEILQHHNEQLSKQLKQLQDAVCIRSECENKLDILFDEVKSVVGEFIAPGDTKHDTPAASSTTKKTTLRPQSLATYADKPSATVNSKGLWSSALHRLNDIHLQWKEARDSSRAAVCDSISIHPSANEFIKTTSQSDHIQRIATHRLFGVERPMSDWREHHGMNSSEATHSVALDIVRVHALQRDLVGFAKAAFDYTHGKREDASPSKNKENSPLVENAQLEALRVHSRHLLLRTACVAPLSPVSCGSALSSSCTGLDAFIDLVYDQVGKRISPVLQQAADRARSESYALVSCFIQTERTLKNWVRLSDSLTPMLTSLAQRLQSRMSAAAKDLHFANSKILNLSTLYRNAEDARIAPTPSSVPVCPLDALTRGCMGEEVAALINSLRLDADDISNLAQTIATIRKHFSVEVSGDISAMKEVVERCVSGKACTEELINRIRPVLSEDV